MIKLDIARLVAERLKKKDPDGVIIVNEIIEALKEAIIGSGRVELRNFGVFQIKGRKPKIGRNPKTRKEYPIPPRRVVTFKPGKEIKTV